MTKLFGSALFGALLLTCTSVRAMAEPGSLRAGAARRGGEIRDLDAGVFAEVSDFGFGVH
jgi:hypothetical protein